MPRYTSVDASALLAANRPYNSRNGSSVIIFLALGYNCNPYLKEGLVCCLLRSREGKKFCFSEDLGNSKGVYNRSMVFLSAFVPL